MKIGRKAVAAAAILAAAVLSGAWWAAAPHASRQPLPDLVAARGPDDAPLWVQRYELTVAEWNICHDDGGCTQGLTAAGGRPPAQTPATMLNHIDAMEYVAWISARTGHPLRLPTAAEWSALARGVLHEPRAPLFTSPDLAWASRYVTDAQGPRTLGLQGAFSVSADGVGDLDGPVWEWTGDCAAADLADRCPAYVLGGTHVAVISIFDRDPARGGCAIGTPPAHLGMRLVTDVAPPKV